MLATDVLEDGSSGYPLATAGCITNLLQRRFFVEFRRAFETRVRFVLVLHVLFEAIKISSL